MWATLAAFSTYFYMYAFRKPFAAATFEGRVELGVLRPIDYKILLIVSQVLGYTLSKFLGIKVVSEMSATESSPRSTSTANTKGSRNNNFAAPRA